VFEPLDPARVLGENREFFGERLPFDRERSITALLKGRWICKPSFSAQSPPKTEVPQYRHLSFSKIAVEAIRIAKDRNRMPRLYSQTTPRLRDFHHRSFRSRSAQYRVADRAWREGHSLSSLGSYVIPSHGRIPRGCGAREIDFGFLREARDRPVLLFVIDVFAACDEVRSHPT
jgi:hypothetical protein